MPADQGLIDSVTNENTKIGAGLPSFYTGQQMAASVDFGKLALGNAVQAQQMFTSLAQAAIGSLMRRIVETDVTESMAETLIGQQATKVAQTTPPETGK